MSVDERVFIYRFAKREGRLESKEYKAYYELVQKSISDISNPNLSPQKRLNILFQYGTLDTKMSNKEEIEGYIEQIRKEIQHIERCKKHGLRQGIVEANNRLDKFFDKCLQILSPRPLDLPIEEEEEEKSRSRDADKKEFGDL